MCLCYYHFLLSNTLNGTISPRLLWSFFISNTLFLFFHEGNVLVMLEQFAPLHNQINSLYLYLVQEALPTRNFLVINCFTRKDSHLFFYIHFPISLFSGW
jgi:hypothetical protein